MHTGLTCTLSCQNKSPTVPRERVYSTLALAIWRPFWIVVIRLPCTGIIMFNEKRKKKQFEGLTLNPRWLELILVFVGDESHWVRDGVAVSDCKYHGFLVIHIISLRKNGEFIVRSMENALRHHDTVHSSSMTQFTTYQVICNITVLHMHSYNLKQSLCVSSRTEFRRYLLAIDNHLLGTQTHFPLFWYC